MADSRCYLACGDQFLRLTQDHTMVAEMVKKGMMTEPEAAASRFGHVVTNFVGSTDPASYVDVFELELLAGDCLLLCTDGLTGAVPEDHVARILAIAEEPEEACGRLITEANERGGRDNVTAVVARIGF